MLAARSVAPRAAGVLGLGPLLTRRLGALGTLGTRGFGPLRTRLRTRSLDTAFLARRFGPALLRLFLTLRLHRALDALDRRLAIADGRLGPALRTLRTGLGDLAATLGLLLSLGGAALHAGGVVAAVGLFAARVPIVAPLLSCLRPFHPGGFGRTALGGAPDLFAIRT